MLNEAWASYLACMSEWLPLIDVRTPAEYAHGHIPGAVNLPLFSNEERVIVGTLYKKEGKDAAVLEGLRLVGPKMANIVEEALRIAPAKKLRVHCWRGGMRSGSVAWLLRQVGFQVEVLSGGYKAYRNQVLRELENPLSFILLGGPTGSGKTYVLHALKDLGEQVIDLEQLAHHKGSAFGALGEAPQPSIEQFENQLHHQLKAMDPTRRIWLESESRKIGSVFIQNHIWLQMQQAPLVLMEVPMADRLSFLVKEYGGFEKELLAASILRIGKHLGGQHVKAALEALDAGDLETVASITLAYYDRSYTFAQSNRPEENKFRIACPQLDPQKNAALLLHFIQEHQL